MGLSLVFGVMNIANFAYGELYILGAYFAYSAFTSLHLGSNGAGKKTALKSLTRIFPTMNGSVKFMDRNITGVASHLLVKQGLAFILDERNLFLSMTVEDNLLMGAQHQG